LIYIDYIHQQQEVVKIE